jgi:LysR family transcriptional regulator, chromosome initiation inhibitor
MVDLQALRALATILRSGSFERAARQMHLTPSAVSQRVRALEERLGCVLLVRAAPVTATPEGERLYRHFLQIEMLEADLARDLTPLSGGAPAGPPRRIPIALNADSFATWGVAALVDFQSRSGDTLAVHLEDQDHTRDWLRRGTVIGAVTAEAEPVSGCRVEPLGAMRYSLAVSPALAARYFSGVSLATALQRAPMLVFNEKDQMQHRFLAERVAQETLQASAEPLSPPQWQLPSTHGFLDAARAGLGWGLHPRALLEADFAAGRLVDLCPAHSVWVPLFWQSWRLDSATVRSLGSCIVRAAAAVLEPLPEAAPHQRLPESSSRSSR